MINVDIVILIIFVCLAFVLKRIFNHIINVDKKWVRDIKQRHLSSGP